MTEVFELNFLPDNFPSAVEFEFSLPETEERYKEATKRVRCPIAISDLRGRESNYDLFRNGFQYASNSLPSDNLEQRLVDMTEEEIASVLVPHTEELVTKMCVTRKPLCLYGPGGKPQIIDNVN
jgi:hypothetical protein